MKTDLRDVGPDEARELLRLSGLNLVLTGEVEPDRRDVDAVAERLLLPLDWQNLIRDGVPAVPFLRRYLSRGARVLVVGSSWSGKSLYLLIEGAAASREGSRVV